MYNNNNDKVGWKLYHGLSHTEHARRLLKISFCSWEEDCFGFLYMVRSITVRRCQVFLSSQHSRCWERCRPQDLAHHQEATSCSWEKPWGLAGGPVGWGALVGTWEATWGHLMSPTALAAPLLVDVCPDALLRTHFPTHNLHCPWLSHTSSLLYLYCVFKATNCSPPGT